MSQSVCEMVELGGRGGGVVKGEVDWSKPRAEVDAAHMAAVGMGGIEAWVGRS